MQHSHGQAWKSVISLDAGSRECDITNEAIHCGAPRIQVERPSQNDNPLDIMPEHA